MNTYQSKTVAIKRQAEDIFKVLSDFNSFTPMAKDKVENWQADRDSCTFTVKGFNAGLKIVEREEFKTIKIGGNESIPMEFFLWIQLKQIAPYDTRMRITIKAELNMMMKMMLGKKLEEGVNTLADGIANAFNA